MSQHLIVFGYYRGLNQPFSFQGYYLLVDHSVSFFVIFVSTLLNLCTFSIPESLTFTNFDALFQFNPYYTDGHVETGGKDSISYTPVGEKLFIICNRGEQSVLLERQLRSVKDLIQFVKNGPDKYKLSMYYYIPSRSHFL